MSRNKRRQEERRTTQRRRIGLLAAVAVVYYVCLLFIIGITLRADVTLYRGNADEIPTLWLRVIQGYIYLVPVVLAFAYGRLFRPFWPNFRNLLFVFLIVHGLYSFLISSFRFDALQRRHGLIQQARAARLKIHEIHREFLDHNQDGLIDKINFDVAVDLSEFPPGDYNLFATITQNGQDLPEGEVGYAEIFYGPGDSPFKKIVFSAQPQDYEYFFDRGGFELNVGIEAVWEPNAYENALERLGRWSPFFRHVGWNGIDPDFFPIDEEVDYLSAVDRFALLPLKIERAPFRFVDFIEDFGRDLDGDGLFDQLVITFEVDSTYEGPVFIQAVIDGAEYPLFYESWLQKGSNFLEFVIDSEHIKALGFDGPYELTDFHLLTHDPACEEEACQSTEPSFRAFFDNYITRTYRLSQFD